MWIIVDGTGTYRVGPRLFKPGATEVRDDDPVIERLRDTGPAWITIAESRDTEPLPKPPAVEPVHEPFEKFRGRDGKWYFWQPAVGQQPSSQSPPYLGEEAVDEAIEEAKAEQLKVPLAQDLRPGPQTGPMTTDDLSLLQGKEVTCRHPSCDRRFRNSNARSNHERIAHPALFQSPARAGE